MNFSAMSRVGNSSGASSSPPCSTHRSAEVTYGENMLNLTVVRGYIKRLLENARVARFLTGNHREILAEFESIAASETV